MFDLPPSDGAMGKVGITDLKEGYYAAEEAFGGGDCCEAAPG